MACRSHLPAASAVLPARPAAVPAAATTAAQRALPWVVGGVVLLVLAVVVVLVLTLGGGNEADDASSVQGIADLAVDAAEDLDVEVGDRPAVRCPRRRSARHPRPADH